MSLPRNIMNAMLAAGCAVAASVATVNAAPGGLKTAVETQSTNDDVVLAAVRNNRHAAPSRPAPRASRPASQRQASRPEPQRHMSRPAPQRQQQARHTEPKAKQQAQKPEQVKQQAKVTPKPAQQQAKVTPKPATQQGKVAPKPAPTQLASNAGKAALAAGSMGLLGANAGGTKPTSYQSKLTSTFKSKHVQTPVSGKGRQILPNMKHNAYMLAGAKGYKNSYRPYWFSNGGVRWYRYYYTAFVGGVAYWYWNNLTTEEVYENRVLLTSYTGGDCSCEAPPVAPPVCDCDDDDCDAE
jgi:hypothetical protein